GGFVQSWVVTAFVIATTLLYSLVLARTAISPPRLTAWHMALCGLFLLAYGARFAQFATEASHTVLSWPLLGTIVLGLAWLWMIVTSSTRPYMVLYVLALALFTLAQILVGDALWALAIFLAMVACTLNPKRAMLGLFAALILWHAPTDPLRLALAVA